EGYLRAGRPEVIIYRRWPLPPLAADDPDREKKSEQRQMLERFFAGFFNPDGSWARSYNPYSDPVQFQQRIVPDLKRLIWALLEQRGPSQALQKAVSPSGRQSDFSPVAPTSAPDIGQVPPAFVAARDESLPTPGDAEVTG